MILESGDNISRESKNWEITGKGDASPENFIARMFGGEAGGFNPDLLSGRLEEMLPTIQQVKKLIIKMKAEVRETRMLTVLSLYIFSQVNAQFRDPAATTFVCVCIAEFLRYCFLFSQDSNSFQYGDSSYFPLKLVRDGTVDSRVDQDWHRQSQHHW